jgi:hypothetical protein
LTPDTEIFEQYFIWENKYELFNKTSYGIIKSRVVDDLEFSVRALFDSKENQTFLKKIFTNNNKII